MAYPCQECGLDITGENPCWYHPLVIVAKHDDGTLELAQRVVQGPDPPQDMATGALPFHRRCLEVRLRAN